MEVFILLQAYIFCERNVWQNALRCFPCWGWIISRGGRCGKCTVHASIPAKTGLMNVHGGGQKIQSFDGRNKDKAAWGFFLWHTNKVVNVSRDPLNSLNKQVNCLKETNLNISILQNNVIIVSYFCCVVFKNYFES